VASVSDGVFRDKKDVSGQERTGAVSQMPEDSDMEAAQTGKE
jgi:hypothetical protein